MPQARFKIQAGGNGISSNKILIPSLHLPRKEFFICPHSRLGLILAVEVGEKTEPKGQDDSYT